MLELAIVISVAHIAAAIALLNGITTTLGRPKFARRRLNQWPGSLKLLTLLGVPCLSVWPWGKRPVSMGF